MQIGVWLSAAFLLNRLACCFGTALSAGSRTDLPRLPRDLTAMVLFSVAVLAIISTVFQRDVTSMLAAPACSV